MRKRTRFLIPAGIVVVLGLGFSMRRHDPAVDVSIQPVAARDLVASVTASGRVEPHTKVDVSSDITGRITRLAVKEGDTVTRGQFLLEIDPSQYRAAVERAVAAVDASRAQEEQARANLLQAQHTYDRTMALKRRNAELVSDEQLDQLHTAVMVNQAQLTSARHSISEAEASLRDAQSALAKTTIFAPMSGRVTHLGVQLGETAIMGTLNKDAATLLTISDMHDLEIKVKVDEADVSRVAVGDSALVQLDAFPDSTFHGLVTAIGSSAAAAGGGMGGMGGGGGAGQTVDYEVTVHLLDVPPTTRPDFSASAKIITATRHHVLAIPIIALTVHDDTTATRGDSAAATKAFGHKDVEGVFVVGKGNRVTFRPVRTGIAGEQYFEVLSGLHAGERVVSGTYQAIRSLKDGMTVREGPATTSSITISAP